MKSFHNGFAVSMLLPLLWPGGVLAENFPIAKVTIKAQDENGKGISKAQVDLTFGQSGQAATKVTDANGFCSVEGPSDGYVSAVIEKEGFYWSAMPGFDFQSVVGNRWQPWNRTFVVPLKKVGRRIPMYVSNVEAKLPIIGEPVGFDLIAGDWVAPSGTGKVADFIFASSLKWRAQDDYDVDVNLRFSNEGDGVYLVLASHDAGGSVLVLPHQAPETGYQSFLPYKFSLRPGGTWDDKKEDRNFFYRVRTAKEHEKVKKALYGKIHRNFRYYVSSKNNITVAFIYYLNPDGTRDLEFNGNNLFPHLQDRNDLKAP